MKTKPVKFLLMAITLLAAVFIASCSGDDDDGPVEGDKTELVAAIAEIEDILEDAEEGALEGQYQAGAKATLQNAVNAAQDVVDDETATQAIVNSALANLMTALETFHGKVVEPIDVANLVGRWRFDEGSGSTAGDDSDNGFDGTFEAGHAFWGAGSPTWTTDRHGDANKAIYFDDGANIEIPYNTALNPDKISISLWMKQDVNTPNIVNNQYMIALNRWNGYKFNMQDVPKPFFTVNPQENPGGHINRDADKPDAGLPQGEWYHLVVTFGNGHMVFYVNGEETKDWEDFGDATVLDISANPVNLTIGQDLPTSEYTLTNTAEDKFVEWGGHFIGAMDEIRIYKSVLTASQVMSIYDAEKPD